MSEEQFITDNAAAAESRLDEFRRVCTGVGIVLVLTFVFRHLVYLLTGFIAPLVSGADLLTKYLLNAVLSVVFLNVLPITAAFLVLKPKQAFREACGKPVYLGSALGMFPAIYAAAIGVNLLTVWISGLFEDTPISDSFHVMNDIQPPDLATALLLFVQAAVIAPIAEELWFRGIILQVLRPFGNGFAIFVSGILFGMTHGNLQQGLYATVIGICLGYIAVSTRSIVSTVIIHAMLNSIAGILMIFMTFPEVQRYMDAAEKGIAMTPEGIVPVFLCFVMAVTVLLLVGACMAVYKLVKIRRYRVEKVWHEVSTAKRWGIFLTRITVIVGLLLALDEMTFGYIAQLIDIVFP
ncbi:MAG: CPBP family intramembrane metalloprotease [Oscillospiraceae bacterium]|nr:CPBP family intramembrane metalloprotease [Oscillospiraceae bacterium]